MVTRIHLRGVAFAHGDAAPLFESVELHLRPGWYGLVGANGAGKTTLLGLLSGALSPTRGTLAFEPDTLDVVVCPQTVDVLSADVIALAEAQARAAIRIRASLSLTPADLDRWPTLSPGERRRWQIGAALYREPDALLIDEPTNHLDAVARAHVQDALARHRGIGVVVSHDRALLDESTRTTLRIAHRTVSAWEGAYSVAKDGWEREARAHAEERAARHQAQERAQRALGDARRERAEAERARSTSRRMKDANDSDARGALATQRAAWGEARAGRGVHHARRDLLLAERALKDAPRVDRELGRPIGVPLERSHAPVVLSIDAPSLSAGGLSAGDRVLLQDVRLALGREDRVRLSGPNGAGKSTLLARLLEGHRPDRVLYLPQELDPEAVPRALSTLRQSSPEDRGRALSLAAALGVHGMSMLSTSASSPGEARKLLLALALARGAAAVVLDEPTNHLDLPSIERLEEALVAYRGALLVVTHDDAFAARVLDTEWRIEGGRVLTR